MRKSSRTVRVEQEPHGLALFNKFYFGALFEDAFARYSLVWSCSFSYMSAHVPAIHMDYGLTLRSRIAALQMACCCRPHRWALETRGPVAAWTTAQPLPLVQRIPN